MAAGLRLAYRLWRRRRVNGSSGTAVSTSLAGLTPAMVALLTLGACCSTTAAAAAGIETLAQASGYGPDQILVSSWYLNIFQLAVLGIALLAQEELLSVAPGLLGSDEEGSRTLSGLAARKIPWSSALVRVVLVGGGLIWGLSFLLQASLSSGSWANPAPWFAASLQRGFLGAVAVMGGLFPAPFARFVLSEGASRRTSALRLLLIAVGVSVAVGVPPPLATVGISGAGNQILGSWGLPPDLGGVVLPLAGGLDWPFVALSILLGLFAIAAGLRPRGLFGFLAGVRSKDVLIPSEHRAQEGVSFAGEEKDRRPDVWFSPDVQSPPR